MSRANSSYGHDQPVKLYCTYEFYFKKVFNFFVDLTSGDNSSVGADCDSSRRENITSKDRVVETKGDEEGNAGDYLIYQ